MLTVDSSAREFVMLRVFVARLTKDLNQKSPIYYILQVCKKNSKQGRQYSLFVALHPANESVFSY
jgi:hypothetical protein